MDLELRLDAVIVAVTDEEPRVLVVGDGVGGWLHRSWVEPRPQIPAWMDFFGWTAKAWFRLWLGDPRLQERDPGSLRVVAATEDGMELPLGHDASLHLGSVLWG